MVHLIFSLIKLEQGHMMLFLVFLSSHTFVHWAPSLSVCAILLQVETWRVLLARSYFLKFNVSLKTGKFLLLHMQAIPLQEIKRREMKKITKPLTANFLLY